MIQSSYTTEHTVYRSERFPELTSERPCDREVIEWLDANQIAHAIVTRKRSAPFGAGSSEYLGCSDGPNPSAVLYRVSVLRERVLEGDNLSGLSRGPSIFSWRAAFTLAHYKDKGFAGAMFVLWDGTYERNALLLDYTPATLDDVIAKFLAWCDPYYAKCGVRLKKGRKIIAERGVSL